MADAMHDARQEGGSYRRIELITGERRRRQWTAEEKARIVAESFEEGANISEVARRNGVVRGCCSATIKMGTQRQSGWPFWRSRREDDLSRHDDNASDIFVTRDLIVVERQSG